MYGTNPIAKSRTSDFMVHSIWITIQGEGPFAGTPAIFLRLAGCNLKCLFCDTEFDEGAERMDVPELIRNLRMLSDASSNCKFIVITGGEPLLQPLHLLIAAPEMKDYRFQIETAGSVWPEMGCGEGIAYQRVSFVVSPKTPTIVPQLRNAIERDVYWKYIVKQSELCASDDGLPKKSTQILGKDAILFRPQMPHLLKHRIFVQACDEDNPITNKSNLNYAALLAMRYGYRLSVQIHKVVGLD